jgi:hypothetical protein
MPLKMTTGCPKNGFKLKNMLLGLMCLYHVVVAPKSAWLSGRIIRVNLYISEMRNIEQIIQWLPLKMTTGCPKNGIKLKINLLGTNVAILCWSGSKKRMVKWSYHLGQSIHIRNEEYWTKNSMNTFKNDYRVSNKWF